MDVYAHAAGVVRARDRDRYLADLFARERSRKHLFALHAFAAEVARVREVVRDPALGEIRLQWWRDALTAGDGGGHPVAAAVIETMQTFALPLAAFEMLLEGRIFDLYDDAMPTMDDLDAHAGQTASAVLQLAALVLAEGGDPKASEAAGHGGVAETLVATLAMLAVDGRRAAKYLPEALLAKHGVERSMLEDKAASPAVGSVLSEVRAIARQHLTDAEAAAAQIPSVVAPAFLPLALTAARLDRMERNAARPFASTEPLAWRRQWIIWRAARRFPRMT